MATGTNGGDALFFEGTLSRLTMSIVNPYTGETVYLDDIYNLNNSTYDGLAGNDILVMTDFGDAIFLENTSGSQTIRNVEVFSAGNGGDALILSSIRYSLGNITLDGGQGRDILWSNNGNDRINGAGGEDRINGGGGNDFINGGDDNDHLNGASGADLLNGEAGDDVFQLAVDGNWDGLNGISLSGGITNTGSSFFNIAPLMSRSFDYFNGGDGYDVLKGTVADDVIVLHDEISPAHPFASGARLSSIELIEAGDGNDIVDLLSPEYAYGDAALSGGSGNDWLRGGEGNDYIDGGLGYDTLLAESGDDTLMASIDEIMTGGSINLADTGVNLSGTISFAGLTKTYDNFDGGAGYDTLLLGSSSNYFSYLTSLGTALTGIEEIRAGSGNDVLNLSGMADLVNVYGDDGNDTIILSHVNDMAFGGLGNDILTGMDGNDTLAGQEGHDILIGGKGGDRLDGGAGNDTLYGGNNDLTYYLDKDFVDSIAFPGLKEGTNIKNLRPPGDPSLGISPGNLNLSFDAMASITFRQGYAGYNNTLGIYAIAADGTIEQTKILWANVKTAGLNISHVIDLPLPLEGGSVGFFLIADGNTVNGGYAGLNITGSGNVSFVYDYGLSTERLAKTTDAAARVSIVYDDGVREKIIKGNDYHTTERGETASLNADGKVHVVSGLASSGDDDVLRIGFEDLYNTGDADYEDVLFDFNVIGFTRDLSEEGDDILIGGLGNDVLYGEGGNDLLVIGLGLDHAYGGSGNDIILYDAIDGLVDVLHGFEIGSGKDVINLSNLLQNFISSRASDFVQTSITTQGTEIRINADGDIGGDFTAIAMLEGVNTNLSAMISQGNIALSTPLSV